MTQGQAQNANTNADAPRRRHIASGGRLRAFLLALAVHLLLFAMLFVGIRWQTRQPAPVQAELWSTPVTAPVPARPAPIPQPRPKPPPPPKAVEPQQPVLPKPDIALERARKEKERREEQAKLEAETRKQEQARKDAQAKKQEQARKDAEARKQEQARRDAEARKQEQARKDAQAREQKLAEQRREAAQAQAQERQRQEYVRRMVTEAGPASNRASPGAIGATGAGAARGAANGDYAGRLSSVIRTNTVFSIPPNLTGNPKAVFEVTLLPDCSIATLKLKQSSGNTAWDQAAMRGIQRSDPFPKMADGTCPRDIEITRGPRDER